MLNQHFSSSSSKKKKKDSTHSPRNPLRDVNGTCSSSSVSIEAKRGCLAFFLSNSSVSKTETPPRNHKSLFKTTPKSAPNAKPSRSSNLSFSRSRKPFKENQPKPICTSGHRGRNPIPKWPQNWSPLRVMVSQFIWHLGLKNWVGIRKIWTRKTISNALRTRLFRWVQKALKFTWFEHWWSCWEFYRWVCFRVRILWYWYCHYNANTSSATPACYGARHIACGVGENAELEVFLPPEKLILVVVKEIYFTILMMNYQLLVNLGCL